MCIFVELVRFTHRHRLEIIILFLKLLHLLWIRRFGNSSEDFVPKDGNSKICMRTESLREFFLIAAAVILERFECNIEQIQHQQIIRHGGLNLFLQIIRKTTPFNLSHFVSSVLHVMKTQLTPLYNRHQQLPTAHLRRLEILIQYVLYSISDLYQHLLSFQQGFFVRIAKHHL